MKKLLMAAVASCVMLAACDKESSYHSLGIVYPATNQVAFIYADQPSDSLIFYTTDNFQVSAQEATWITIPDSMREGKIANYYRMVFYVPVYLTFDPNTTGTLRTGRVTVRSFDNDDWDNTSTAVYCQFGWHNVTYPTPKYSTNEGVPTKALFKATVGAEQETDTLEFVAYTGWTLTDGSSFVHVDEGMRKGAAGHYRVPVRLDVNATTDKRSDAIQLSGNGVVTPIEFEQEAPKTETTEEK